MDQGYSRLLISSTVMAVAAANNNKILTSPILENAWNSLIIALNNTFFQAVPMPQPCMDAKSDQMVLQLCIPSSAMSKGVSPFAWDSHEHGSREAYRTSQQSRLGSTGRPTPSERLQQMRQSWGSCWGAWPLSSTPAPPDQTCTTAPSPISPPPCLHSSQSVQAFRHTLPAFQEQQL